MFFLFVYLYDPQSNGVVTPQIWVKKGERTRHSQTLMPPATHSAGAVGQLERPRSQAPTPPFYQEGLVGFGGLPEAPPGSGLS